MEYKNLTGFVLLLVLVGMLVGVGVLTLDKFAQQTKESTTILNESFTMPAQNQKVTLAKGENITSLTSIINVTGGLWGATNYSFDASDGTINNTGNVSECTEGETCYATYIYDEYNTKAAVALNAGRDAVGDVSSVWLGLIVTIAVLAIIITLVITGFSGRKR